MRRIFFVLIFSSWYLTSSAQFIAKMQVKEHINGLCDEKNVIVMFSTMKGQQEAVCPISKDAILKRLNAEVSFLKDSVSYNDKGMMGLVINCKGVVVQCRIDNHTKNPVLDKQIELVFNSLGEWKPGKLNGKEVDTSRLFSFKIINGVFSF